ncbi:nucleotide pyrophosphohydrolase [Lachnospiraceae bacterium OttesenSCG-928-J05]|nr:nucleotide pyrophosphohydrolase [Lachnospiraceae bacterium OttesenSCG-928-J05]
MSQLEDLVKQFCEERDWDQYHSPKELAIGLSTESNELLDLFRFKTDSQMKDMLNIPEKIEAISEELADILFFLLRFSQMYNFDLEKSLKNKIQKNDEKYPTDRVKGKNLKYTEYK